MTEQAQHSSINAQVFSADAVKDERYLKTTTPLIWLETAQSTQFRSGVFPGSWLLFGGTL